MAKNTNLLSIEKGKLSNKMILLLSINIDESF